MPQRPSTFKAPRVKQRQALISGGRGTTKERGYDHAWRKLSLRYRAEHPLCKHCEPRAVVGDLVDHVIPIAVRPDLRLDEDNLQTLCTLHHQRKTALDIKRYGAAAFVH